MKVKGPATTLQRDGLVGEAPLGLAGGLVGSVRPAAGAVSAGLVGVFRTLRSADWSTSLWRVRLLAGRGPMTCQSAGCLGLGLPRDFALRGPVMRAPVSRSRPPSWV